MVLGIGAVFGIIVAALAAGKLSNEDWEQIRAEVLKWVIDQFVARGFNLNPDDPFSDSSIANAVSEKTGIPLRSVKNKAIVEEDVATYAGQVIADKTGLFLTDIRSASAVEHDVLSFAGAWASGQTGIPLGNIDNPAQLKDDLKEWGIGQAYEYMAKDFGNALELFKKSGIDIDTVVRQFNDTLADKPGAEPLTARQVGVALLYQGAAGRMSVAKGKVQKMTAKTRRQLQMRAATMRFRALHGNRMKYSALSELDSALDIATGPG